MQILFIFKLVTNEYNMNKKSQIKKKKLFIVSAGTQQLAITTKQEYNQTERSIPRFKPRGAEVSCSASRYGINLIKETEEELSVNTLITHQLQATVLQLRLQRVEVICILVLLPNTNSSTYLHQATVITLARWDQGSCASGRQAQPIALCFLG